MRDYRTEADFAIVRKRWFGTFHTSLCYPEPSFVIDAEGYRRGIARGNDRNRHEGLDRR